MGLKRLHTWESYSLLTGKGICVEATRWPASAHLVEYTSSAVIVKNTSVAEDDFHREYHGDVSKSISWLLRGFITGRESIPDPRQYPSPWRSQENFNPCVASKNCVFAICK